MTTENHEEFQMRSTCCPCGHDHSSGDITRRGFLQGMGGAAALGVALTGLTWSSVSAAEQDGSAGPKRRPLVVKPILVYSTPRPRPQTSWRSWGGIQTEQDAAVERNNIRLELNKLGEEADFPVEFLPVSGIRGRGEVSGLGDLEKADVFIVYAAGGGMDTFAELAKLGKDVIFFCRHKSGPVYLWYEIISPRYLRQHTDKLALKGIDDSDVVIDSQDELLWRLRALCGLRNTTGTKILAIGGPGAWAQPKEVRTRLFQDIRKKWQFEMKTVPYKNLGELIKEAKADDAAVQRARRRAGEYLKAPGNTLETKREFLDNAFLLEQVFRGLMKQENCRAITINGCMGTIMPLAETSACMTLCLLNDAGYMAFCESDFVVIPSGVLMVNISGRPMFLNDPTYPHDGVITLAHCTSPRRMNGKDLEPVRIMTHFESDYGAAPKVEMSKGQVVTNIVPDFKSERWVGMLGEIIEAPFMDICRSQIDIRYTCDDLKLAERMPGFHWMSCYGDYMREIGYALKKVQITWETLA